MYHYDINLTEHHEYGWEHLNAISGQNFPFLLSSLKRIDVTDNDKAHLKYLIIIIFLSFLATALVNFTVVMNDYDDKYLIITKTYTYFE